MASESDGGLELGKRPHVKTHRWQEYTAQKQGDGGAHKVRICPVEGCNKTFTSAPGLKYHVKSHGTEPQQFLCERCKKSFKSQNGLKYHQKNTKCEENVDSSADDHDEPDGTCDASRLLYRRPVDVEFDGMDNLRELAIIATGPQSPLLKSVNSPWDKHTTDRPSGSVVRTLDLSDKSCMCRQTKPDTKHNTESQKTQSSVSVESDPKVTSSSPFPSSPKNTDSPDALWTHSWPTPTWQCFMSGTTVKFLSGVPTLGEDWHSTEELSELMLQGEYSKSEDNIVAILHDIMAFRLRKQEKSYLEESESRDLYFSTETSPSPSHPVHLLAQCTHNHPFFVKEKGWSSCSPTETEKKYGLPCQQLTEGDVCLPPSHPDASFCQSYQLSTQDCTAAMALSCMAQKKNQERQSHSSPDSPSKEDMFKFDLPKGKRPMNAFMLFAKENRIQYTQKHPGMDNRQISVLLGDEWRKLSGEEKKRFKEKSEQLAKEQKTLHPDCWKRKK